MGGAKGRERGRGGGILLRLSASEITLAVIKLICRVASLVLSNERRVRRGGEDNDNI